MAREPIQIDGLREFASAVKKMDGDRAKMIRTALNEASNIIIDHARRDIPRRTGRAAASLKGQSTRVLARVRAGSSRAPYYPWLDFGGRVGRNRSVKRPFYKKGRYIWKAYSDHHDEVIDAMQGALVGVVRGAGVEVT